jgi:hypothetical protein
MSRYTIDGLVAEIRRQAAQRNATWPCILLSDLVLLVDEFERLKIHNQANRNSSRNCRTPLSLQGDLF